MDFARLVRHLFTTRRQLNRRFPPSLLSAIEAAIARSELRHRGEIRFVIEASLDPLQLIRRTSARERALEVFSALRVWDTQDNSGVLIYLLFADRAIEIIADRGIHAKSGSQAWDRIAAGMQDAFTAGAFERGALDGIDNVARELIGHLPSATLANQLSDDVTLL